MTRNPMHNALRGFVTAAAITTSAFVLLTAPAHAQVLYSSLPTSPYGNPALGYQATQTNEFGDEIGVTNTSAQVGTVTIGLSNFAIASTFLNPDNSVKAPYASIASSLTSTGYYVPLTLNIYSVNPTLTPTVGTLLATQTVNTFIPWRPENNPSNNSVYLAPDSNFYDNIYTTADFNLSALNLSLPADSIITLAFNTQSFGSSPTGIAGPYNSLNFTLSSGATVGTDVNTDAVFWNTSTAANYADGGAGGTGTLRQDTTWSGTVPAIQVTTAVPEPSTFVLMGAGLGLLFALRRARRIS